MLASLIFFLEVYHFLTHVLVLFGIRLLPRKDLVKQRIYFMIDLVCANISYWIHGRFLVLIGLQNLQHLFYFFTWEQRYLNKFEFSRQKFKFLLFCLQLVSKASGFLVIFGLGSWTFQPIGSGFRHLFWRHDSRHQFSPFDPTFDLNWRSNLSFDFGRIFCRSSPIQSQICLGHT